MEVTCNIKEKQKSDPITDPNLIWTLGMTTEKQDLLIWKPIWIISEFEGITVADTDISGKYGIDLTDFTCSSTKAAQIQRRKS